MPLFSKPFGLTKTPTTFQQSEVANEEVPLDKLVINEQGEFVGKYFDRHYQLF